MGENIESDAVRIPQIQYSVENPQIALDHFYDNKEKLYYKMNHKHRGLAIIFNHRIYEPHLPLSQRKGTNRDCERLKCMLEQLGFHIEIYNDLKSDEIRQKLLETAEMDHSNHDCLWLFILTHGEGNGYYFAKETVYQMDDITNLFKADKCKTLAGKPKILTIQACQGQRTDIGYRIALVQKDANSTIQQHAHIPSTADFLICHSSSPGYISYRHERKGSWYIKELCEQLEENAYNYDFFTLLTQVAQNVAFKYRTKTPIYQQCFHLRHNNHTYEQQMPYFTSTLTKILKFQPPPPQNSTPI